MLNQALAKLGLDEKQAATFIKLLSVGSSRASSLAKRLNQPRTTTQNVLERLQDEGLVVHIVENGVKVYTAKSPEEVLQLIEQRRQAANRSFDAASAQLQTVLPQLKSMMQSNRHLPGVQFFKGKEGVRTVLMDTLTSKTELKDFANVEAMYRYVKDINDEYVAAREKTDITKRSLLLDTAFARKVYESGRYSPKSHKGYKWINSELYPFALEMNIYDGKVSYITYVEDDFVGVIIENEHIYEMHNSMWNLIWDLLG